MSYLFGAFLIAHGLVHGVYVGQSLRLFELKPGLSWPDGSWALSSLLRDSAARQVAAGAMAAAGAVFIVAGVALLLRQGWWSPVAVVAAAISAVAFVLLWNGRSQELDAQGGIAVLINAAILVAVLVFRWPGVAR